MRRAGRAQSFGAVNVLCRDAADIVDLVLMIATWLSPVLYTVNQGERDGQTLVIVSHDLDMVKGVTDRGIVLQLGVLVADAAIGDA